MVKIRKAVIPVGGLGTRFLPATKTLPKELLPIISKPSLQYVIEEAYQSGITEIILVTSPIKGLVEQHFKSDTPYDKALAQKGKTNLLIDVNNLINKLKITSVIQHEAKGLGHATLCAKEAVGNEYFLLMLPDMIVDNPIPCAKQLIDVFKKVGKGVLSTEKKPKEELSKYGVFNVDSVDGRLMKLSGLIEKPDPKDAPSSYIVSGQYLLPPSIFKLIENTKPGALGEIQITDALDKLAKTEGLYGYEFEGRLFDTGDRLGYLEANIYYGLKDEKLKKQLIDFIKKEIR